MTAKPQSNTNTESERVSREFQGRPPKSSRPPVCPGLLESPITTAAAGAAPAPLTPAPVSRFHQPLALSVSLASPLVPFPFFLFLPFVFSPSLLSLSLSPSLHLPNSTIQYTRRTARILYSLFRVTFRLASVHDLVILFSPTHTNTHPPKMPEEAPYDPYIPSGQAAPAQGAGGSRTQALQAVGSIFAFYSALGSCMSKEVAVDKLRRDCTLWCTPLEGAANTGESGLRQ